MNNCSKRKTECDILKACDMSLCPSKTHLELGDNRFHTTARGGKVGFEAVRRFGCWEAFAELTYRGMLGLFEELRQGPRDIPYP